jgi:hypothetical protein
VRILVLRLFDQLTQPVEQLPPARLGDGVHRPLWTLTFAAGLLLDDEAGLG